MLWSPAASSSQQRARVLTDVKPRRFAPPPLRGADGLDVGSAHARPAWLLPTWIKHVLGFRRFSLRGLAKVRCEWDLVCLALNVKRLQPLMAA